MKNYCKDCGFPKSQSVSLILCGCENSAVKNTETKTHKELQAKNEKLLELLREARAVAEFYTDYSNKEEVIEDSHCVFEFCHADGKRAAEFLAKLKDAGIE